MADKEVQESTQDFKCVLYVTPRNEGDSKKMKVFSMSNEAVKNLQNRWKVSVYLQPPGASAVTRICPDEISLPALCAFIPAVYRAFDKFENEKKKPSKIAFLVLPHNDIYVYRKLLGWMDASVRAGMPLPYDVGTCTEDFKANTLRMAQQLGIGWVEHELRRDYQKSGHGPIPVG